MSYVVITQPATEPLAISEVMAHLRLDESNQELPPSAFSVAIGASGAINAGTHRWLATFVTASGETQAGTASQSLTLGGTSSVNLTNIPIGGAAITGRKIYRTQANGSAFYLVATIANNSDTSFTDDVLDAALGVQAPITNTTLDGLLYLFIKTARQQAERRLGRWLVTQTIDALYDAFPSGKDTSILLPPVSSVASITYIDSVGVQQTLSPSLYSVDTKSIPSRIEPSFGNVWPATGNVNNAVTVRFVAGYGAASSVPECIKTWMLVNVNTMWETRTQFITSAGRAALTQIPNEYIDSIIDPECVFAGV